MEVILDGEVLAEDLAGENLREILEDLCGRVLERDRTLKELLINGRPYEERTMSLPQDIGRQRIQKLEVTTISSWEVAQHFLSSADVTLQSMIEGANEVAELFRVSDEQEANEQISAPFGEPGTVFEHGATKPADTKPGLQLDTGG